MKTKSIILKVLVALIALVSVNVYAQDNEYAPSKYVEFTDSLGLIKNVHLVINDQVEGMCWTNINQVKQNARLTLEQSGISVYDEPLMIISPLSTNLIIAGHGRRSYDNGCYGNIELSSYRIVDIAFGNISVERIGINFKRSMIVSSEKNLNDLFVSSVDTLVSMFCSDVIAGRRNPIVSEILKNTKNITPTTKREFGKMVKEVTEKE